MAIHDHQVITAAYLTIGSATLTLDGQSVTISHSVDLVEDSVWGDTWKQRLISLQDYQLSFEALGDQTDDELNEDLDALMGTNVAVAFRASSGAIAVTNPEYQFTGAVSNLTKTFAHGQVVKISGTIMLTTSAGVTRDVTP
jgi:hypothetical protein